MVITGNQLIRSANVFQISAVLIEQGKNFLLGLFDLNVKCCLDQKRFFLLQLGKLCFIYFFVVSGFCIKSD